MSDRPYGGINDTGMNQTGLLDAVAKALGPPGTRGTTRGRGTAKLRGPATVDPRPGPTLEDWYRRSGAGPRERQGYNVGSDPDLERMLATRLGWDQESETGLYEHLGNRYSEGRRTPGAFEPGMNSEAAQEIARVLLGMLAREGQFD